VIRLDEALSLLLAEVRPLPAVAVRPERAAGLRLAAPLVAATPLPPFDDAAMDGWAVRAADVAAATREAPVALAAGRDAAPIATGGRIPAGFDAVLPLELARVEGDRVLALSPVRPGAHVRRRGEDVAPGDELAPAGAPVDPGVVAAACALGVPALSVHRRPRAAVLPVGRHVAEGRPDATGPAVAAALRALGVATRAAPPAPDDATALAARIAALLPRVDLLVTVGAASAGPGDVVPDALRRAGARLVFHGVAVKPGKPVGLAIAGGTPVLVLSGNPAAALATFDALGRPLAARLAGAPLPVDDLVPARLAGPLERRRGKAGLVRGTLAAGPAGLVFAPLAKQGSGQVSALVGGEALAIVPPDVERLPAGSPVEVRPLAIPGPAPAGPPRVFAVSGWSGAGKTHVVAALVRELSGRGIRVATVKHDVHGFDPDPPGKDTAVHRAAGAIATALVAPDRTALVREGPGEPLVAVAARLLADGADLVLAEGFKDDRTVPKIEVTARGRPAPGARPLFARVDDGTFVGDSGPPTPPAGPGTGAAGTPPVFGVAPADLARLAAAVARAAGLLPPP
jgi:molybdopterin molybdotransferase